MRVGKPTDDELRKQMSRNRIGSIGYLFLGAVACVLGIYLEQEQGSIIGYVGAILFFIMSANFDRLEHSCKIRLEIRESKRR